MTALIGFSKITKFVDREVSRTSRELHKTASCGIDRVLREDLTEVWNDCRLRGWDGFDALPVTRPTYRNAIRFLESLPIGCQPPTIGTEPDGHLTFEWYRSANHVLSVSIDPKGYLYYAAILGPNRENGKEAFFGDAPENILRIIRRVCSSC